MGEGAAVGGGGDDGKKPRVGEQRPGPGFVVTVLIAVGIGSVWTLVALWPGDARVEGWVVERRLFVIAVCAGMIGATVHGLRSAVAFLGNGRFDRSWVPWYIARPVVGGLAALAVYFLLRGGLLSNGVVGAGAAAEGGGAGSGGSSPAAVVSPFGVAAIGVLVGLFTERALDKLAEVIDQLFRTDRERLKGKLEGDDGQVATAVGEAGAATAGGGRERDGTSG